MCVLWGGKGIHILAQYGRVLKLCALPPNILPHTFGTASSGEAPGHNVPPFTERVCSKQALVCERPVLGDLHAEETLHRVCTSLPSMGPYNRLSTSV